MTSVFISYRRADSGDITERVYDELVKSFGPGHIFWDIYTVKPGRDYREELRQALDQCQVMLVLIGETWATLANDRGKQLLSDPIDWVRVEVETGLKHSGLRVIPVLLKNARLPDPDRIPASLHKLLAQPTLLLRSSTPTDIQRFIQDVHQRLSLPYVSPAASSASTPARPQDDTLEFRGDIDIRGSVSGWLVNVGGRIDVAGDVVLGDDPRIRTLERQIDHLKNEVRPKIQGGLKHAKQIGDGRFHARQSTQDQKQRQQTLLMLVGIVVISLVLVTSVHVLVGGIAGAVMLGALFTRESRRSKLPADAPETAEVQQWRFRLNWLEDTIAYYEDEVKALGGQLSYGGRRR